MAVELRPKRKIIQKVLASVLAKGNKQGSKPAKS